MLKHIFVPGLQYQGESMSDLLRRERIIVQNNLKIDELWKDWERQRATPMKSYIPWAKQRGLIKNNVTSV